MKKIYTIQSLLFSALILGLLLPSYGGPEGMKKTKDIQAPSLSFTVKTLNIGGNYSPKHVLAIWVEDSQGNFVKTRKMRANSRKQHLVKWVASSNNNVVDAITGSTLNSHTTHTVTWDCKDVSGNIVPDGNYTMNVEFTSRNSAYTGQADGPTTSISFTKDTVVQNISPADETYFVDMSLSFDPGIGVGVEESKYLPSVSYNAWPNPFRSNISISCEFPGRTDFVLAVYSIDGVLVEEIFDGNLEGGSHVFNWNAESVPAGIYILKARSNGMDEGWSIVKMSE